MEFRDRTIILGVTGGIAVHKSLDLASQLVKGGASVHVAMTANATRLVQPLQFQVISRNPVLLNLFEAGTDWKPPHIDLADRADLLAIVPATANIIGKLANGIADDALSTVAVSVHCPILLAPAMNGHMYQNPFVQRNIDLLKTHGVHFIEPASGDLACGYEGRGRLNTVETILQGASDILSSVASREKTQDLKGTRIVVTAGATREHIDPVRFITNRSSGKMGYAIAEAATQRGAEVRLISGTATVLPPVGIMTQHVETTLDMYDALLEVFNETDIVIMAGAPADYRPSEYTPHKIKKSADTLTLPLERNPDIAQTLGAQKTHQTLVCFAAETNDLLENAKKKLIRKNCDLIVANDILEEGAGFQSDTNIVTLLDRDGTCEQLPRSSKRGVADAILTKVVSIRNGTK
ncbi:bifunctional phosphopantothenoylcysteine decarboxylase/phosphopantothenate--cysteine ligase CoaBC [Candidatus Poribacteria bacterium]|nr:bifunctional phosphopantothenoylcysteine decarboxylase/phosphopantothenate--cysteine ligase CoaBC [Candidatus Poribacteria bacterium]MYG05599.1 bifunctional phosphopantothenoylcysteine decarboxylase/phosphopantothenate--cysteine ligase CoaBC [Candidatus Poribacteria bacterium]MYK25259.1 bifunctional phosphopantothenoylcysteine decarboxylase/phosphopantothenate--cysteine ligase CoaBC [Candidatus Poribacteria bacterium]